VSTRRAGEKPARRDGRRHRLRLRPPDPDSPEKRLEVALELDQIAEALLALELDKQVDVGVQRVITPDIARDGRAEELESVHVALRTSRGESLGIEGGHARICS